MDENLPASGGSVVSAARVRVSGDAVRVGPPRPAGAPEPGATIENEFFRVSVDPATGLVSSIHDKRADREVLAAPGNDVQFLEDMPTAWDAWNIGLTGVRDGDAEQTDNERRDDCPDKIHKRSAPPVGGFPV